MLKVVLGDLIRGLLGRKGDRRGVKIGSMSRRKGSPALEKGHFKRIGRCLALQSIIILIEGTRNANGGMRSLSICVGW